jgi:hypothetical protein
MDFASLITPAALTALVEILLTYVRRRQCDRRARCCRFPGPIISGQRHRRCSGAGVASSLPLVSQLLQPVGLILRGLSPPGVGTENVSRVAPCDRKSTASERVITGRQARQDLGVAAGAAPSLLDVSMSPGINASSGVAECVVRPQTCSRPQIASRWPARWSRPAIIVAADIERFLLDRSMWGFMHARRRQDDSAPGV